MVRKRTDPEGRRNPMEGLDSSLLAPGRTCSATSKATGERCKRHVRPGFKTCAVHGSSTRASKTAAAKRIAQASGYAAEMLVEFMADPETPKKDRIQIAQDLLNRANVVGKTSVEFGLKTVSEVFADVVLASTRSSDDPVDPDNWDDPRNVDAEGYWIGNPEWAGTYPVRALPATRTRSPAEIEAELVEDRRIEEKDRRLAKVRKRVGDGGALPPEPRKPDIAQDPRTQPRATSARADARRAFEADLLRRIGKPKPSDGSIRARSQRT